jgi:hypothetical protein
MIERFVGLWEPIILPMAIGSVPVGILLGVVFYVITRSAAVSFRRARVRRLEAKARARAAGAGEAGSAAETLDDGSGEAEQPELPLPNVQPDDDAKLADAETAQETSAAQDEGETQEKPVAPEVTAISDTGEPDAEPEPVARAPVAKARGRRKKSAAGAVEHSEPDAGHEVAEADAAEEKK